jgi:hypothetical protein
MISGGKRGIASQSQPNGHDAAICCLSACASTFPMGFDR